MWQPSPIYCLPRYPNACAAAGGPARQGGCGCQPQCDLHMRCSQCTWGNFKTCITPRVCMCSASHRQPKSWHKADRHRSTESQPQKQGGFFIFFFLNEGMGKKKKNPIQKPFWVSDFGCPSRKWGKEGEWGEKEKVLWVRVIFLEYY